MFTEPIMKLSDIRAIKRNLSDEEDPRDYLLFTLGINTALRISDLLKLTVKHISDDRGKPAKYLYLKIQKTGKTQKILLNDAAQKAISYYLRRTGFTDPTEYLFVSNRSNGEPMTRVRAHQLIKNWSKDAGLKGNFSTHTLRKTWGYQARQKGISWALISEKLGHRSLSVTRRYLGVTTEEVNKIEDIVNL